jgi:hypothetical protein
VVRGIVRFFACVVLTMLVGAAEPDSLGTPAESVRTVRSLLKKGKVDEAYSLAERARDRFVKDAAVQATLGDVNYRLAEFDAAEGAYRRALDLDVNCARAHYGMGRLLEATSRWKSARVAYDRAHELDAGDFEILRAWATGRRAASEEISGLERYWDSAAKEDSWLRERAWSRLEWRRMVGDRNTFVVSEAQTAHRIGIVHMRAPQVCNCRGLVVSLPTGKTLRLELDSGTSGIALKPQAAKRIGLKPRSSGCAADDPNCGKWAWIDSLRTGTLEFRECPIRIRKYPALGDADGTIGTDVFQMFLIRLDFPHDQMELSPLPSTRGAEAVAAQLPSWPDEDALGTPPERSAAKFLHTADGLIVPVFAGDRARGYFLFEPRLGPNLLTTRFANRLRLSMHSPEHASARIRVPYRVFGEIFEYSGTTLRFGGVEQQNTVHYSYDGELEEQRVGVRIAGHLGVPNPADFTVTIDYRDGWIDFQLAR